MIHNNSLAIGKNHKIKQQEIINLQDVAVFCLSAV